MDCYLINIRLVTKKDDDEANLFQKLNKIATEAVNANYQAPLEKTIKICEKLLSDPKIRTNVSTQINSIYINTNALLIQVNDVLDGITLKQGHLNKKAEYFNPFERIMRIVDIIDSTLSQHQKVEIRPVLTFDKKLMVWGEAGRMDQVIFFLVQFCL
jgi:hypothetical protein